MRCSHRERSVRLLGMRTVFFLLIFSLVQCQPRPELSGDNSSCEKIDKLLPIAGEIVGSEHGELDPPGCLALGKREFLEYTAKLLEREATDEELREEEAVFKAIGLIPESYDYSKCIREAFVTEGSAFYSPHRKKIILPNWYTIPESIILHESVHYLQDKSIDIASIDKLKGFYSDSALAIGAVLEGDALLAEERYLESYNIPLDDRDLPSSARLTTLRSQCILPNPLRELFYFQYDRGFLFWDKLEKLESELTRLDVLKNPPMTTREVLYAEEYLARMKNSEKDGEKNGGEQYSCPKRISPYTKSLGEFAIRTLFLTYLSPKQSLLAAHGVAHDCITKDGDEITWDIYFDTTHDRDEFHSAIKEVDSLRKAQDRGQVKIRSMINAR